MEGSVSVHPRHSWLAAVLPAEARRFRVRDSQMAAFLVAAGAELVEELARHGNWSGGGARGRRRACSGRSPRQRAEGSFPGAAGRTAAGRRCTRPFEGRTWQEGCSPMWLFARHRVRVGARFDHASLRRRPRDRSPTASIGYRSTRSSLGAGARRTRTVLEAALEEAEGAVGKRLEPECLVLGASGVVFVPTADAMIRVGIGPPARRIEEQQAALSGAPDGGTPACRR